MKSPFHIKFLVLGAALVSLLAGCSDFRFVNAKQSQKEDPRELLRLINPRAELTSGSRVTARLIAHEAVYSDQRRKLELTSMTLFNFDGEGNPQGKTVAKTGNAYFADNEAVKRKRNDIELKGSVTHEMNDKASSDTQVWLETDSLLWDTALELFRGDNPFHGVITQADKPPMQMQGKSFVATKNMRSWQIRAGAYGAESKGDLVALGQTTLNDLESSYSAVTAIQQRGDPERIARLKTSKIAVPKVSLPQTMLETSAPISVPAVNPAPMPKNGSACRARNSSGSASPATGKIPTRR